MSFKYINPGYIKFIGNADNATQSIGYEYSKTGICFTQTGLYSGEGIPVPEFTNGDDFWAKFDFYLPPSSNLSYWNIECLAPNTEGYGLYILNNNGTISINAAYPPGRWHDTLAEGRISQNEVEDNCGVKFNFINSALLHVHYGDQSSSYMDISLNNKVFRRSENYRSITYTSSQYNKKALLYARADTIKFSNIILANEEINIKEAIISLPISSTDTEMTFDSETGIYTATAENQKIFSSVNVQELMDDYGSDSTVTGIALIGNPSYKTASGLSSLTALSKKNEITTEYGTYTLDTDSNGMILDSRKIENTIVADLQNIKFGWKAGA